MNSTIASPEAGSRLMASDSSKESWYALAASAMLAPNSMLPIILLEQRLVLWRDDEARPHLWRDHCPHRGARLSIGRIGKDAITCRYHGLRFNENGYCNRIPAVPDLVPPKSLCVETFPVEERFGLLWGALKRPSGHYLLDGFGMAGRTQLVCRSFSCTVPADAVLAESLNFRFFPYGPLEQNNRSYAIQSKWPLVAEIICSDGATSQIAAVCLQPVSAQRSVAHLAVSLDGADADLPKVRSHFNEQFSRLRRKAEHSGTGATVW